VTRGTRLKKLSSSRGFARKARGAWGSWGLKTEIFFSLFKPATTTNFCLLKIKLLFIIYYLYFCVRIRAVAVFTASADGKNPFADKTVSAG
jgi:hypothetical protein